MSPGTERMPLHTRIMSRKIFIKTGAFWPKNWNISIKAQKINTQQKKTN